MSSSTARAYADARGGYLTLRDVEVEVEKKGGGPWEIEIDMPFWSAKWRRETKDR